MKIPALIGMVLATLVVTAVASAAKPQAATVTPSCNPCAVGSVVAFSGSGFEPGLVAIWVADDATGFSYADENGNFESGWPLGAVGEFEFVFYQFKGDHKQIVKATLTIQVV